ncbi:ABC transporter permease [Mucilaginibacter jinjuensis]|uniref:ABC transporter permease n=1 Tax=Mucilaginibacter jinjuensis TaxID=1176721 RepID=A0ABY7T2X5_9SPHI|nr:ABC transporter permease [Mucilaginibacter jinjuensis]WCT10540.1 ABC transporter permease [Mucilaginibacter jinjuensis]
MIKNYFKIAWRKLKKNRLYSFVNILGLTAGLASCLLIGLYLYNELTYDNFHQNANRIARVTMEYNHGSTSKTAVTGSKDGPQLKRMFPEVEDYVRTIRYDGVFNKDGKFFHEDNILYADQPFFKVFSFHLLEGSAAQALSAPDHIVLTSAMAKKYFGDADPMGKTLKLGKKDYVVSGIAANIAPNSQIHFDFVVPFDVLSAAKNEEWFSANYVTYLLLKNGNNIQPLQKQISAYMQQVSAGELKMTGQEYLTLNLEPLKSVHLHSQLSGLELNGSLTYIYILFSIALLILIIAAVNYTNLAVAQSAGRSAEISIRKVLGASTLQLFRQFIGESVFFTTLATVLAILVAYTLLPQFNAMAGKNFTTEDLLNPIVLVLLMILSIVISFVAGAYPSLLLSNVKLIKLLKSGFAFTGNTSLRQSLIVFQFVISFFLIISTTIIIRQLNYIQTKDVGYNRNNVIVLPLDYNLYPVVNTLKTQMAAVPNVEGISVANSSPVNVGWGDGITTHDGKKVMVNAIPADENFVSMFKLKILAGTNYTHADVLQMDTTNNGKNFKYSFIINESTAKALGWTPEEAIGKTINRGNDGVVKAVVKDFNFRSLHDPITPLIIFLDNNNTNALFLKVADKNAPQVLHDLEAIWKHEVANYPFSYHFLDDDYNAIYVSEQRTAAIFKTFAILAVLLGCLGLFALTAYSVLNRTKEIGIRKVLGASVSSITLMLSKNFMKLVLVAIVIASPIAWYAMHRWLQDFAYRIAIQWYLFVLAGLVTIIIAFVTVSFQSIKAAVSTPVKSLRSE